MPTGSGGGGSTKGWPLTAFFSPAGVATQITLAGANQVYVTGFALPYSLTFSHITIFVNASDAVNSYDAGLYTQAGALVANIGAQTLPSTGIVTLATVQAAQTINPGLYLFAFTGNATTANIWSDNANPGSWRVNSNVATSSGGALPASITAQTVSMTRGQAWFGLS